MMMQPSIRTEARVGPLHQSLQLSIVLRNGTPQTQRDDLPRPRYNTTTFRDGQDDLKKYQLIYQLVKRDI
jgi:hypothetical protein